MNPLDLSGPRFLVLYLAFLASAYLIAALVKRGLNLPAGTPPPEAMDLDAYQVALLDGRECAVRAAVVALAQDGVLMLEHGAPTEGKPPRTGAHALERSVHATVREGLGALEALREKAEPVLERLEESLRGRGLLRTERQDWCYRVLPLGLFLAALVPGLAKVAVGLSRGKPVSLLVMLLLMAGLASWVLSRSSRLTARGEGVQRLLRLRHEPLRVAVSAEGGLSTLHSREMALAVGLFGAGALALPYEDPLRDYLLPPPTLTSGGSGDTGGDAGGGSGCSGGSSCGSSSSCGGGSGCGGCGGGGGD